MANGNIEEPIITQEIDYTYFPLAEIGVWFIVEGTRWIMLF
jgi:hypothetical protein